MAKASFPYDAKINDLHGKPLDLASLAKDKALLCVNVASKCGFTGQYAGLEGLYQKYKDRGLVILGFPCNQFGGQEPGSSDEIATCSRTYSVTFPITEKVEVNGDNTHDVYKFLKSQKKQLGMERIKWNFEFFLVAKDGTVAGRYSSITKPEAVAGDIEKLL